MTLVSQPIPSGDENGPTREIGYPSSSPVTKWSAWLADMDEPAADVRWPLSVKVYHRMRTDAQVDGIWRATTLPIRRSRWVIDPNGARDEVVESTAKSLALPIRGTEDVPPRRRRGFSHDDHLRQALLAGVYGHFPFEIVGNTDGPGGAWQLERLSPRLPSSISDFVVADNGDLVAIKQWPRMGDPMMGKPIPAAWLVPYVWDKEGANWTGRSMLRSCYKYWLLKDRALRVNAQKDERFGLGIPYATAPPGATKDTVQRYAAMARSARADADSGVGLPHGGDIGVEGIRGTLPDVLASINYYDEQMARAFLAMVVMLGSTASRSGSRALGESFVDFFKMGVDAIARWYADMTQAHLIDSMVEWNFGPDETPPLIDWDEDPESRMNATDLVALVDAGAIVVDNELRTWISDRWGVSDPGPGTPTPPGPSITTSNVPEPTPSETPPAAPTPTPTAARAVRASRVTHGTHRHVARTRRRQTAARARADARSQTATKEGWAGHRQPNDVEVRAKTDFVTVQKQWEDRITQLVSDFGTVRSAQIDDLVSQIEDAVDASDVDALVSVITTVDGANVIATHMLAMMEDAVVTAKAEAAAQGVNMGTLDTGSLATRLTAQAGAVADIIANGISQSAAFQAFQRYGVNLAPATVGEGVRQHLESLSDSYLNDTLGGALTQAQNAGRMFVMGQSPGTLYASELLDDNTCDACAAEDGTEFDNLDDANADYPAGGFSECAGGPRCRGTIVAVYDEATTEGA